jgi:Sigma-70 region 2
VTGRNEFSRQPEWLAQTFEAKRTHPRAVAYRMLGSRTEADDAVQEAWLRLSRSNADEIENLGGWLTTVVAHICLDMLRSRTAKREEALDVPDGATAFDDRSCHIRRTSFVRVMTDQVMQKEKGFETENDWLLDGYVIGSVPAAIGRRGAIRASERNGRGHHAPRLPGILCCHSWVLESVREDRLARTAFPSAEGMGLRGSVL